MLLSICISQGIWKRKISRFSILLQEMQYFRSLLLLFISADSVVVHSVSHIKKWNAYLRTWEKLCICSFWRKSQYLQMSPLADHPECLGMLYKNTSGSDNDLHFKHATYQCCQMSGFACDSHSVFKWLPHFEAFYLFLTRSHWKCTWKCTWKVACR